MKKEITGKQFRQRRLKVGLRTRQMAACAFGVSHWTIKAWELKTRPVPSYAVRTLELLETTKGKA